jgi:hypothetical protein
MWLEGREMNDDKADNGIDFYEYLAGASRQAIRMMIKDGICTAVQARAAKSSAKYEERRRALSMPNLGGYAYS